MSAAVSSTVHAVVRKCVLSIMCTSSRAPLIMSNLELPSGSNQTANPVPDDRVELLDAVSSLAFISRLSPALAPLLLVCYADRVFFSSPDPSFGVINVTDKIVPPRCSPVRVVPVEPSQSSAILHVASNGGGGSSELLIVRPSDSGVSVVGAFSCKGFSGVQRIAAVDCGSSSISNRSASSSAGGAAGAGGDAILCIVSGAERGQVAAAVGRLSVMTTAVELVQIPGLETPDIVTCHTLQRMTSPPPSSAAGSSNQQHFVWWACWKVGIVTACHLVVDASGVRCMSTKLQRFPTLEVPGYVAAEAEMSVTHTGGAHIAIWNRRTPCLYLASVGNNINIAATTNKSGNAHADSDFLCVTRSEIVQLASPAACARPIRGDSFLLIVGMHSTNREPWSYLAPLYGSIALSANVSQQPQKSNNKWNALELGRALLSLPVDRLVEVTAEADKLLTATEERIRSPGLPPADIAVLERELLQLRAFRFALLEREKTENAVAQLPPATRPSSCVAAWDRRLHTSFVLLQVVRLLAKKPGSSNNNNNTSTNAQQRLHFYEQARQRRQQARAAFIANVSSLLKLTRELQEFTNWVSLWPAQLVVEAAAEQVGVLPQCFAVPSDSSGAVEAVVEQLQPLIERSMDVIDGCLEWVAFFALYAAFSSSSSTSSSSPSEEQQQQERALVFVNALHVPPVLVQLASMARTIDSVFAAPIGDDAATAAAVSTHQAAQLANQTCVPVRRLLTSLFSAMCDTGSAQNLRAAYSMTSVLTMSHLIQGGGAGAMENDVALRLGFLAAERQNLPLLSVLLRDALSVPPERRSPDASALALFLLAAAAKFAATCNNNSLQVFEGRLAAHEDQSTALLFLQEFGAPKLRIELLVHAQRHAEALDATRQYSTTNPVEQHWASNVIAHLRAVVTAAGAPAAGACSTLDQESSSASSSSTVAPLVISAARDDAAVVRPIPVAFYNRGAQHAMYEGGAAGGATNRGRCRVVLPKTEGICGCEVPCPYHATA